MRGVTAENSILRKAYAMTGTGFFITAKSVEGTCFILAGICIFKELALDSCYHDVDFV